MNISHKPICRLLAVAFLLSGCLQSFLPVILAHSSPLSTQKPDRQSDEATRPRRVSNADRGGGEPLIRIGLMTDVNSVAISSSSGLIVRRFAAGARDDSKIAGDELRVEIRRQPDAKEDRFKFYRAEVASVSSSRDARKITDNLEEKFSETATMIYDERAKKYRVLIGEFDDERDAENMIKRLRREGYRNARVTSEQISARRSKSRAASKPTISKPGSIKKNDSENRSSSLTSRVVALEANKLIASSEDTIIITPAEIENDPKRAASGSKSKSSNGERTKADDAPLLNAPPLARVGKKDYRGEIHLALNPRGRINVINVLPLEEYLRGVVPLELPPWSFPEIESLKAQAVAARTYAISHRNRFAKEGFDLRDDARSQVYGGFAAEHALSNRAVEETRGMTAVYIAEDGSALPIEALYTSTCGGRTEDNEAVFLTRPVPYLRSVECAPDRPAFEAREIASRARPEPLLGPDGRYIGREVALFEALGFKLPRRVTNDYLRDKVERKESLEWAERAASLSGRSAPADPKGDVTRLPAFASLVAAAVYGEGRASLLMSRADVDYTLAGFEIEKAITEMRADIALLLKEGALQLPPKNSSSAHAAITRGWAIETIARAIFLKSQSATLRLHKGVAAPSDQNRLLVVNANRGAASSKSNREPDRFDVDKDAWLFRRLGNQSYAVESLTVIGGERVTYHLNKDGRIDFLEAEPTERGAASDRMSTASQWQERMTLEELQRKLAQAGARVGEIEDIEPVKYGASNRVIEMDVIGKEGRSQLRGYKVRTALGLKESLFVIERERDERGRIKAFIFTGRGWGHGVGMCQTGAYGLAKVGLSYREILQKYYTGIKVQKMY